MLGLVLTQKWFSHVLNIHFYISFGCTPYKCLVLWNVTQSCWSSGKHPLTDASEYYHFSQHLPQITISTILRITHFKINAHNHIILQFYLCSKSCNLHGLVATPFRDYVLFASFHHSYHTPWQLQEQHISPSPSRIRAYSLVPSSLQFSPSWQPIPLPACACTKNKKVHSLFNILHFPSPICNDRGQTLFFLV